MSCSWKSDHENIGNSTFKISCILQSIALNDLNNNIRFPRQLRRARWYLQIEGVAFSDSPQSLILKFKWQKWKQTGLEEKIIWFFSDKSARSRSKLWKNMWIFFPVTYWTQLTSIGSVLYSLGEGGARWHTKWLLPHRMKLLGLFCSIFYASKVLNIRLQSKCVKRLKTQ